MKSISSGGDYAEGELERFQRRLDDLSKEADAEKQDREATIQTLEGDVEKTTEEAYARVDEVYKVRRPSSVYSVEILNATSDQRGSLESFGARGEDDQRGRKPYLAREDTFREFSAGSLFLHLQYD